MINEEENIKNPRSPLEGHRLLEWVQRALKILEKRLQHQLPSSVLASIFYFVTYQITQ